MQKNTVIKREKGQGMTEYIIIVALIAIAAIAIIETFGQSLRVQAGKITDSMQGKSYSGTDFMKVTKDKTKRKSLRDFASGNRGSSE